jgi:hypothetical protein
VQPAVELEADLIEEGDADEARRGVDRDAGKSYRYRIEVVSERGAIEGLLALNRR